MEFTFKFFVYLMSFKKNLSVETREKYRAESSNTVVWRQELLSQILNFYSSGKNLK